mgnify:CR=1 FL=1
MKFMKKNGGFTLVELIVVIAILAILAGVAVPAYSGYVEKANESADQTLLASVNTAFAAACAFNGESNYGRTDSPSIAISSGAVATNALNTANDKIDASFAEFFEGGTFKVYTEVVYMPRSGAFVKGGTMTFNFGGQQITLNASDVAILSGDNAFSDRGSAALLGDVGALETYLAGGFLDDSILGEIGASDDFMNAFAGYLGLKREDYETDDAYTAAYEEKLTEIEKTNPNATTNALIMYAASSAAGTTQNAIDSLFGYVEGSALTSRIEGSTNAETMANAALAYGMYTAYAENNGIDTTDPAKFSQTVNTEEFAKYVASPAGQADLEAYMAAMNMVSNNTGNPEITGSVLANGIVGNQDLSDLMKDVMGS